MDRVRVQVRVRVGVRVKIRVRVKVRVRDCVDMIDQIPNFPNPTPTLGHAPVRGSPTVGPSGHPGIG